MLFCKIEIIFGGFNLLCFLHYICFLQYWGKAYTGASTHMYDMHYAYISIRGYIKILDNEHINCNCLELFGWKFLPHLYVDSFWNAGSRNNFAAVPLHRGLCISTQPHVQKRPVLLTGPLEELTALFQKILWNFWLCEICLVYLSKNRHNQSKWFQSQWQPQPDKPGTNLEEKKTNQ